MNKRPIRRAARTMTVVLFPDRFRRAARVTGVVVSLAGALLTSACRDIGRGGTGERVVPPRELREIGAVQPHEIGRPPARAPSTLPSTRATVEPLAKVPLTLADVRELALRNNLDLQVSRISPALANESLFEEEAQYEALFTTSAGYSSTDSPSANQITQQQTGNQSNSWNVTPGVQFPLRTGGVVELDVPLSRFETDTQAQTLNPAYTSDVAARITQPLLRGGGIDVNAQPIRVAFYGYQQAQARAKLEVTRVLADADRVYWRLFAAREALLVRRQEYDLAVAQLRRARSQVDAGAAAEVEIVRAQSGVADRIEAIITSENTLRDTERQLKRILNSPDLEMESPTELLPATPPRPVYMELDVPNLVSRAMAQRMELLETELEIALATASVRVARHETLPLVNVDYTYNINGLGGGWDDSFDMVRTNDFVDHRVGLRVEVPIGNAAARSRLRRALLNRVQALATLDQRRLLIRQEVLNAADQFEANWQRILAARQRVLLAQRLLEVEIRQFEQGLRTSTEVLNAQTQLASAQLSEISAVADYQIAQVDIAFATGTVLGQSSVVWEPATAPKK